MNLARTWSAKAAIFLLHLSLGAAISQAGIFGLMPDGQTGWGAAGTTLAAPAYDWWYGCTPTSAGMLMGYYDRQGYGGLSYDNLIPGGVAESQTFTGVTGWNALADNAIASRGHVAAFYSGGYGASGDDNPALHPQSQFDSLADFMGTSQDSAGNSNGWTMTHFWRNGAPYYAEDAASAGLQGKDATYGIGQYIQHQGYDYPAHSLYTQLTDNDGQPYGFSFADFQREIDAGRPVLVWVTGHTMLGYGYDPGTTTIHVRDTWSDGDHTMPWDGAYDGLDMWGVTVLSGLTGGTPEPCAFLIWSLLGALGISVGWWRRKRSA